MILKEVHKGPFWNRKRYYFGWAQAHGFLIEADWFDKLPKDYQEVVYKREYVSAYKSSLPRELK